MKKNLIKVTLLLTLCFCLTSSGIADPGSSADRFADCDAIATEAGNQGYDYQEEHNIFTNCMESWGSTDNPQFEFPDGTLEW